MQIGLTPMAAALIWAGRESPLFRKRGTFMSAPTWWLERESFNRSIGGLVRLRKPKLNRQQRRK